MKRSYKRGNLGVFGVLLAGAAGFVGYADHTWEAKVDAPYPQIHADVSPEGVTRGAAIFNAVCAACHVGKGSMQATGAPLDDAPAFLGTFHSANITADKVAGVGALNDEEIARTIRYGVNRHNHRTAMPSFSMSDADVASVIGFLRSGDPLFRPDPTPAPPSHLSLAGKAILVASGAAKTPELPAEGVVAPEKKASPEYGKYLVESVYGCGDCHTPGYAPDKAKGPDAFTGGFEMRTPQGEPIVPPSLRPETDGIVHHDNASFRRAVREGKRQNGTPLRAPMPQFKGVDDTDLDAVYMYLETLPKQRS